MPSLTRSCRPSFAVRCGEAMAPPLAGAVPVGAAPVALQQTSPCCCWQWCLQLARLTRVQARKPAVAAAAAVCWGQASAAAAVGLQEPWAVAGDAAPLPAREGLRRRRQPVVRAAPYLLHLHCALDGRG